MGIHCQFPPYNPNTDKHIRRFLSLMQELRASFSKRKTISTMVDRKLKYCIIVHVRKNTRNVFKSS